MTVYVFYSTFIKFTIWFCLNFFFKQKILTSNTFTVDLQIKKKMVKNYKMLLQSKLIYTYLWNISKTRTSNQVLQFTQVNVFKFCDKHIHWHLLSIQLQRGDHLRYPCIAVKFFTVQDYQCTSTLYEHKLYTITPMANKFVLKFMVCFYIYTCRFYLRNNKESFFYYYEVIKYDRGLPNLINPEVLNHRFDYARDFGHSFINTLVEVIKF